MEVHKEEKEEGEGKRKGGGEQKDEWDVMAGNGHLEERA
jgi:hypothetical protein